jgi:L,D-transpeptidase YcbB
MKSLNPSRADRPHRHVFCAAFLRASLFFLLLALSMAAAAQGKPGMPVGQRRKPTTTSTEAASAVRSLVQQGNLPDLRWPNFSDFRAQIDNFYRGSNYSLAWIENSRLTPRAEEMIHILSQAEGEGLNSEDYDGPRWPERMTHLEASHTAEDEARFDVALTVCAMRYISAVRIGRINPQHLKFGFDIKRKKIDLPAFLGDLLASSNNISDQMAEIEPPFDGYKAARQALRQYQHLAKTDQGASLPPSIGTVYRGGYYDHMADLASRLRELGDMPQDAVIPDNLSSYDEPFITAVKSFQQHHGLNADGYLTAETIEQLNVPLRVRAEQLGFTLERYRWIPLTFSHPPVVVNLPEFRLRAFDKDGRVGLSMRVNVGDAYDFQTPVFENKIQYLVFRPYWNVPPRILREEVIPDIEDDRDYVENNNMEVINRDGQVVTAGPINDSVLKQLRAGSLGVREKPGPDNALGLLKIIFPNEHHVYLHDTPESRDMFSSGESALSHGCIHLQEPAMLAHWLLRDKPEWTEARVEQAMKTGRDNLTVNLTKPVPILIVYATAIVEPDGAVYFFRDIYGHDATLKQELAKGYPYP